MTSVNVMPGRPSSPIVSLPTFWKETQKVILPIREPKLYVSGKISLCVECLEKYLLHGNSDVEAFDIPELEVRPGMKEPMTVSDPLPPQLCECDELGSICGLCKILMDKIVSSTASSSSCSVSRTEDETMPQSLLNSSDSAVSSHHLLWTLKQQIILEHLGEYFSLYHVTLRAT